MKITEKLIQRFASKQSFQRGKQYFLRGLVHIEEVSEWYIRATVKSAHPYVVELFNRGDGEYETSCTCPFDWGGDCVHIVATSFAAMETLAKQTNHTIVDKPRIAEPTSHEEPAKWKDFVSALSPEDGIGKKKTSASAQQVAYGLEIKGNERRLYALRLKRKKGNHATDAVIIQNNHNSELDNFDHTDRMLVPQLGHGFSNYVGNEEERESYEHSTFSDKARGHLWISSDYYFNDLLMLLGDKELFLIKEGPVVIRPLVVSKIDASIVLNLRDSDQGFELTVELLWGEKTLQLQDDFIILANDPLWLLIDSSIIKIGGITGQELSVLLANHAKPLVRPDEREQFLKEGLPVLLRRYNVNSNLPIIKRLTLDPIPCLYLREIESDLQIELRFKYSQYELPARHPTLRDSGEAGCFQKNGFLFQVVRNIKREYEYMENLEASSLKLISLLTQEVCYSPTVHTLEWLKEILPNLQQQGYLIFGQESLLKNRINYSKPTLIARVSSGIDWFDLNVEVSFDGLQVSFEAVEAALRKNERFVQLSDGSYGLLPEQWMEKFHGAFSFGKINEKKLRFARTQIGIIEDLLEAAESSLTDLDYDSIIKRMNSFENIAQTQMPTGFQGELRTYQRWGYDWLHFLRDYKFGGILADDMGLGKTVQTIALLQKIYENGAQHPSLIIVPTSILFNWQNEVARFAPNLRALSYRGTDRKELLESFNKYNLIITSYGILRRDIEILKDINFEYAILDESQNIKNYESVGSKASRLLRAENRLALSGTPVENNLLELWSQFTFLNPGMLGNVGVFADEFVKPIERDQDEVKLKMLKRMVYPFILRRTKELVESDLPPKQESIQYCEMDESQQLLYNQWKDYYRTAILKKIDEEGMRRSKLIVLEGLMRLRQICCHPRLVDTENLGVSAKFEAFTEMLDDILAEGHKVLVFSQFVKMLKIFRSYLDEKKISYEYLDGHTIDREKIVSHFQNDESVKVFLISLKAGGTGLNLTAADYVIIFDPWWNPAVELQATDRAHRIGQKRHVFAYKFITKETVEEKILLLQEKKKELVSNVISTDSSFFKKLTREDIAELFS